MGVILDYVRGPYTQSHVPLWERQRDTLEEARHGAWRQKWEQGRLGKGRPAATRAGGGKDTSP